MNLQCLLVGASIVLAIVAPRGAGAIDHCRAKQSRDGSIVISAKNITGAPLWGGQLA